MIVIVSAVFCYVIFNVYIMYMINRLFRVFHNCYVLHERLHLFRSNVEPVENMPRVDWNSLHIVKHMMTKVELHFSAKIRCMHF